MTNDKIRIKIAESLGWKRKWENQGGAPLLNEKPEGHSWVVWFAPSGRSLNKDYDPIFPPNYPDSLNACAEFEKTLTYEELEIYEDELCDICKRDNDLKDNPLPWRAAVVTATALQRCLAYLKTKGLIP